MGQCKSNTTGDQFTLITEEIPESKTHGFSAIYKKVGVDKMEYAPDPDTHTLFDAYNNTAKKYGDRPGIGYVVVNRRQDKDGKEIEDRSVKTMTYKELYQTAYNLGKAAMKKHLTFQEPVHGMKFVGMYSKNRYEWLVADWTCVLFGITTIPLYDTLGIENLTYCLKQTELTTLFISGENVQNILKLQDLGNLKNLILFDWIDQETQLKVQKRNLQVIHFKDLISDGSHINDINNSNVLPKPDDCYTFSYTSGTTGPPKGAMLSHKNMLAFIRSADEHSELRLRHDDVYPSYLPLPHLMERCMATVLFYHGACMVCTCGDVLKLKDDCQVIKPTILLSVPRLFNKIVDAVRTKFAHETGIKKWLVDKAINTKLDNLEQKGEYKNGFYDSVVFSKVREGFGGKVRLMGSGSAPLSPEVHEYMIAIMCCPLIEAYGQTQSSAGILYSNMKDKTHGQFAEITACGELKTCDIPEMKYTANDKDETGMPSPRGELWLRGPQVFLGYYKQTDLTQLAITSDGWLKTGDIVQVFPDKNAFKIIDRKKNIFKLQQGEYVAPEKVEHIYGKTGYLNASEIFLHGSSHQNFSVLIATPLKDYILEFAKENKIEGSYEQIINNRDFKCLFLKDLNSYGKKEGLYSFEMAKNIYFEPEGFMNKNILTNTMKLIRHDARLYYKQKIDEMYAEGDITLAKK